MTPADPQVVIWARAERAAKGPAPAHSRAEIAAASISVADAEGLDGVSMRRVATQVGTGTTSLYRYVNNKDELVQLMVDAALGECPPPAPTGDWRFDLHAIAHQSRALMLRHPWMVRVSGGHPVLGPNSLTWMERGTAALVGLGLAADEISVLGDTLNTFVRGFVSGELAEQASTQRSGKDMDQWMAAQGAYGEQIITSGKHPSLARIMIEAQRPHAPDRTEQGFELGLDCVLDGIAAAIAKARARPRDP